MTIKIVHMKRSGLTVPKDQLFDLSRSSKKYYLLSNEYIYYNDYKILCKIFNVTPVDISGNWLENFTILEELDEKLKGENL